MGAQYHNHHPPTTMQLHTVRGDGNCFFYALYGAARSGGILAEVLHCFRAYRIGGRNEVDFAASVRRGIAANILLDRSHQFRDVLTHYRTLTRADLVSILSPDTHRAIDTAVASRNPYHTFLTFMAMSICTDRVWVNEIIVQLVVVPMLAARGIRLEIISMPPGRSRLSADDVVPRPARTLVLVNEMDVHYGYMAVPHTPRMRSSYA